MFTACVFFSLCFLLVPPITPGDNLILGHVMTRSILSGMKFWASRVLGLGSFRRQDRDYVPGQKRLSGSHAGIKTQQSRVLQCSMTVAVCSGVDGLVARQANDRR